MPRGPATGTEAPQEVPQSERFKALQEKFEKKANKDKSKAPGHLVETPRDTRLKPNRHLHKYLILRPLCRTLVMRTLTRLLLLLQQPLHVFKHKPQLQRNLRHNHNLLDSIRGPWKS